MTNIRYFHSFKFTEPFLQSKHCLSRGNSRNELCKNTKWSYFDVQIKLKLLQNSWFSFPDYLFIHTTSTVNTFLNNHLISLPKFQKYYMVAQKSVTIW